MLAAYTELKNAQKVKDFLLKNNLFNKEFMVVKELGYIYFPVLKKVKVPFAEIKEVKFSFPRKEVSLTMEEILKEKLSKKELELLPSSQEVVGSILILELPEELLKKEKLVAEAFLKFNKTLKTVVRKDQAHVGVFRTRKFKFLAGKNVRETLYRENNVSMKVDIEKAYFSARLAHERQRINDLVKKNELVLVMFSGVAPYPLVLAKNSSAKFIVGVEINPQAHELAMENVQINQFGEKIKLYLGDVREIVPKFREKFDRVVMPLPKTGEEFLDVALPRVKKNGMIHLYAFLSEEEVADEVKKINRICKDLKYKIKIVRQVKCGQFSPRTFRYCFDIVVL